MTPLLEIEKLTIRFGGLTAVKQLDLRVERGRIFAVIGPNGAGKTTVFNAISGIYDATSGEIRFRDRPLRLEMTFGVVAAAVLVGLATMLGAYLLALNPDSLWNAAVRRPSEEAQRLDQRFSYTDALARAAGYLRGGLVIEYVPRFTNIPLVEKQAARRDAKVAFSVPAFRIVSADDSLNIRSSISDDFQEPQLEAAARRHELLRRSEASEMDLSTAAHSRDEIARQMADSSRQLAMSAVSALTDRQLSAVAAGDQWQLTGDGEPIAGLFFRSQATAEEAIADVEELRAGWRGKQIYRLFAPLLGLVIGIAGYFAVWNRARRSPEVIARSGIARTFQNIRLFHNMTVLENVLVGMDRHYTSSLLGMVLRLPTVREQESQRCDEALELLEFAGLAAQCDMLAKNLPYGDQRRLEIARALGSRPELLLLDEPAAGMNPAESVELMQLIRAIRDRGITVLLIEHHMRLVMGISDRIAVLQYGVKIAEGSPEEVRQDPRVIEAYLGQEEVH